jgi:iron complex outermembrane receptor protein
MHLGHALTLPVMIALVAAPATAHAAKVRFDIDAQPARYGVGALAKQGDIQILAPEEILVGRSTRAVRGEFPVEVALERLLAGSGLAVGANNGRVITLRVAQARPALLRTSSAAAIAAPTSVEPPARSIDLGEIVVTAQRRSELARDVPITITSATGEQMERAGVTGTRDLQILVPALNIDSTGYNVQPALRGVTTALSGSAESSVAVYMDGVYQPDQAGLATMLPDVARVDVLKGPQGTLFGRNATGGAIVITTRTPEFHTTGMASVSYGNFNAVSARGFITGPLVSDVLAGSLSLAYDDDAGYYHDLLHNGRRIGGLHSGIVHGKLLFKPTDRLSVTLAAYLARRNNKAGQLYTVLDNNVFVPAGQTAIYGRRPYDVGQNSPSTSTNYTQQYSAKVEYVGELGTLSTLTSAFRVDHFQLQDLDYTSLTRLVFEQHIRNQAFQQEINFASRQFGKLSFTAGLFGYYDYHSFNPIVVNGGPRYTKDFDRSVAAYGEITYRPTDRLTIIGGLRYSRENRVAKGAVGASNRPPKLGEKTWDAFTPRLAGVYRLTDKVNLFATYSQGFKSGVFNSGALSGVPVNPEKITSYEVGTKGVAFDRRLSWNASAFAYVWRDVQLTTFVGIVSSFQNAARVEAKGAELDSTVQVSDELDVRLGVAYLDAEFTSFPRASVLVPLPGVNTGNVAVAQNLDGARPLKTPKWTLSSSVNYVKDIDPGRMRLSGTYYYSTAIGLNPSNRVRRPAYSTVAAEAAFRPAGSRFELSVWGRNLTDEKYIISTIIGNAGDGATYSMPRTFGVKVDYSF